MACATTHHKPAPASCTTDASRPDQQQKISLADESHLEYGKRLFEEGFYKRAMQELLPVAADGSAEAQYAVGYMYYYGFGVTQDTNVGYFWIQRAACQHYVPAIIALKSIQKKHTQRMKHKPCQSQQR